MKVASSYSELEEWQRVFAALPTDLQPPEPLEVEEEFQELAGFKVHVDRWKVPSSESRKAKMIVLHGGGGTGRLVGSLVWSFPKNGIECICPDLPGYDLTFPLVKKSKKSVLYEDWRNVASEIVEAEAGDCPIFIYGLSMGGMLAYDTAVMSNKINGLLGTCFLDARLPAVRKSVVRWPWLAIFVPMILKLAPSCLNTILLPMPILGKMQGICNDKEVTKRIIKDQRSGGNWMPLGFLRSWLQSGPLKDPEAFHICPVLMVHPADDRWTDVKISLGFFNRLGIEKRKVMLENAGHFPIEAPGREQHHKAIIEFITFNLDK